jgi:hypothetical protein
MPTAWTPRGPKASTRWSTQQNHGGRRSLLVSSDGRRASSWEQKVTLQPGKLYVLSAWVKTEAVADQRSDPNAGAQLSVVDSAGAATGQHTVSITGTRNWTYRAAIVRVPADGVLTVRARIGSDDGLQKGKAWFDDIQLLPVLPNAGAAPSWRVLALVYDRTDVTFPAADGTTHRASGMITPERIAAGDAGIRRFITEQVPRLDSGLMKPRLSIVHRPVAPVTYEEPDGWWVDPRDVDAEVAGIGQFDAVMVFWQDETFDVQSGEFVGLTWAAGFTPNTETGPAYSAMIAGAPSAYDGLNILKHEFGHQITTLYRATGAAAVPEVDIHQAQDYVHCGTGTPYVIEDESDSTPIPNSTYNDTSGFTHDYYSGTTALASAPRTCLGISASTWATGGAATHPYRTVAAQVRALGETVTDLTAVGALSKSAAAKLNVQAAAAATALDKERVVLAAEALEQFTATTERLRVQRQLSAADARVLRQDAQVMTTSIKKP